jgi:PEP-CTERM motif
MRKYAAAAGIAALLSMGGAAQAGLIITGVFDAPLPGGDPKGVELTATSNIADLSVYGLETVGNGGVSNGVPDSGLPAVALSAGDRYYVTNGDGVDFAQWFGFAPDFPSAPGAAVSHNGDDVIILYESGVVHDQFGETGIDGTGTAWESLDGWAYRNNGATANGGAFSASNWFFSGPNAWDGDDNVGGGLDNGTNAQSSPPMPIGTYVPEPASLALIAMGGLAMLRRRR